MGPVSPPPRRYAGKTLEERRAERRLRLLDAGLELFGTRGYGATTIEQLCRRARLNPRYFYEQFESREALLGAVYDRHVEAVAAQVRAALHGAEAEPLARLQAGLRAFLEQTLADERAARINYFEIVGVSPALETRRRAALRAYANLITSQLEALRVDLPALADRRLAAVALVGAVDGLVIDALAAGDRPPQDHILETLLGVFGAALGPASEF